MEQDETAGDELDEAARSLAGIRRLLEYGPEQAARHLALLTRTIEVVNSSLDLQEVMEAIAHEVAAALGTDACFVYLYDERTDELVLRATHGTRVEDATIAPRMRRGEGITGVAAAERAAVMIPSKAHLDPRFKAFPEPPRGRLRVDPRRPDPRAGHARGRPERQNPRAEPVQRRRDRAAHSRSPRRSGSRSSTRSCSRRLGAGSRSSRRSRASRKRSRRASISRSRSRRSCRPRSSRSARPVPRSCSRTAASPGPKGGRERMRFGLPLRWRGRADR